MKKNIISIIIVLVLAGLLIAVIAGAFDFILKPGGSEDTSGESAPGLYINCLLYTSRCV